MSLCITDEDVNIPIMISSTPDSVIDTALLRRWLRVRMFYQELPSPV